MTGVVVALGIASYMYFPRAEARPLFPRYESVRQSLVRESLAGVKSNAAELANDVAVFAVVTVFISRAETSRAAAPPAAAMQVAQTPLRVLGGKIVFRDAKAQAEELIGYYHSINLTPGQEAIKKAALQPMPAACCRDSSAYTCCCPCNLSKTIWGLSNLAISKYGANAKEVQQIAQSWLASVNPSSGFSGDSCYTGGCSNPAHRGGCAGMTESTLDV